MNNNSTELNSLITDPWLNRFEIPLTVIKTRSVFEIIQNVKYNKYIQCIYLPPHGRDAFSGRRFYSHPDAEQKRTIPGYDLPKDEWVKLIKEISLYKSVALTIPFSHSLDLIKEYIDYGVSEIMVNSYWDGLSKISDKVKISRSILAYHDSDAPVDERFDGVVVPYRKTMDLSWLEEHSKRFELIAIVNNYCVIECPMKKYKLDIFKKIMERLPLDKNDDVPFSPACLRYGKTTSAMLPRDIVLKLSKYISRYKLIERVSSPAAYVSSLNYYIYDDLFCFDGFDPDVLVRENLSAKKLAMIMKDKEDHFRGSNLETLNCKFQCADCQKRCFSVSDWNDK